MDYIGTPDPEDIARVVNYPGVADVAFFHEYDFVFVYNHSDNMVIDDILKRAVPVYEAHGWGASALFDGIKDYIRRTTDEEPEVFEATAEELFAKQQQELGAEFTPEEPQYFITVVGSNVVNLFRSPNYVSPPELRDDEAWSALTDDEYETFVAVEGSHNLEVTEEAVEYYDAATRGGAVSSLSEYAGFML